MTDAARSARHISPLASAVAELLRRYPRLQPREKEELLASFKALTILDLALIMSDESLRGGLDAFRRDHKSQLRPPLWHYLFLLGMPVSMLVAVILGLWHTGAGG